MNLKKTFPPRPVENQIISDLCHAVLTYESVVERVRNAHRLDPNNENLYTGLLDGFTTAVRAYLVHFKVIDEDEMFPDDWASYVDTVCRAYMYCGGIISEEHAEALDRNLKLMLRLRP